MPRHESGHFTACAETSRMAAKGTPVRRFRSCLARASSSGGALALGDGDALALGDGDALAIGDGDALVGAAGASTGGAVGSGGGVMLQAVRNSAATRLHLMRTGIRMSVV